MPGATPLTGGWWDGDKPFREVTAKLPLGIRGQDILIRHPRQLGSAIEAQALASGVGATRDEQIKRVYRRLEEVSDAELDRLASIAEGWRWA